MSAIRRVAGVGLVVIGVAVALHLIVVPLYHVSSEASPNSPVWAVIDPFMALAIVMGTIFGWRRRRACEREGDDAPVTREYLAASTQFYGFLFVGILFFSNWFDFLSADFAAIGEDTASLVWVFVDAALSLLAVSLGVHLVRNAGQR